jgi:hypothetical protein
LGAEFLSSLQILDISPLLDEELAKIFFHSVGCLLSLVTVSFAVEKLFSLISYSEFSSLFIVIIG